jgi:hypothetical protein
LCVNPVTQSDRHHCTYRGALVDGSRSVCRSLFECWRDTCCRVWVPSLFVITVIHLHCVQRCVIDLLKSQRVKNWLRAHQPRLTLPSTEPTAPSDSKCKRKLANFTKNCSLRVDRNSTTEWWESFAHRCSLKLECLHPHSTSYVTHALALILWRCTNDNLLNPATRELQCKATIEKRKTATLLSDDVQRRRRRWCCGCVVVVVVRVVR